MAAYRHEVGDAYNGACSQSVEFVSGTGTVGIANAGLNRWGIAMRKGQTSEGRLYLRGSGDVVVALQSADGTKEYASQRITGIELLKKMGIESVESLNMQLPDFRQDFCFAVQKKYVYF